MFCHNVGKSLLKAMAMFGHVVVSIMIINLRHLVVTQLTRSTGLASRAFLVIAINWRCRSSGLGSHALRAMFICQTDGNARHVNLDSRSLRAVVARIAENITWNNKLPRSMMDVLLLKRFASITVFYYPRNS